MSQELTTQEKPRDLKSLINSDAVRAQIARALPKHITPDRFLRVATTMLLRVPKLANCSQESFMRAMLDCSSLGLEPDGRRAHLIPYGSEVQLIVDWKGLVELAKRSGEVATWKAETVKERDAFAWENGNVTHSVNWREDRGKLQCVYSVVKLASGETDTEVMTLAEVEAIRKRSRAGQTGPWVTDFEEMAKKTVIRRHSKRLTLSPEFADALDKDADSMVVERDVTPVAVPQLIKKAEPAPVAPAQVEDEPPASEDLPSDVIAKRLDAAGIEEAEYLAYLVTLKLAKSGQQFGDIAEKKHSVVLAEWDAFLAAVRP